MPYPSPARRWPGPAGTIQQRLQKLALFSTASSWAAAVALLMGPLGLFEGQHGAGSVFTGPPAPALLVAVAALPVLVAAGWWLAGSIARRISGPVQALVAPALAIGRGERLVVQASTLQETQALGHALQQAQQLLHQRDQARQAAELSLAESQARLRIALDACLIGDWDLDVKSGHMQRSLRHDQCFGYRQPVAAWTTETFLAHVHPDDVAAVRESLQHWEHEAPAVHNVSRWQRDVRVLWPDGTEHWLICACSALFEQGELVRMLGIVVDITDRKQREALLSRALRLEAENRQIQHAHRVKSEFLAHMSHELRTPLNAVIGFTQLLQSGAVAPGSPQVMKFLGHIAASGQHLQRLIDDVLDLSKVESGSLDFAPQPLDLARVVQEVVGVLHSAAENKHIRVQTDVAAGLNTLLLDPARLKQVLYNLLSNAIKFTGSGGRVSLRAAASGADLVCISVTDSGIGIADADQAKLFRPFQQVGASADRRQQGTGLGLALTRRLVEGQGGSISVHSRLGAGSTFEVLLPQRARAGGV